MSDLYTSGATPVETSAAELKAEFVKARSELVTEDEARNDTVLDIIAAYYASQDMPLKGMLFWVARDWNTYKSIGTCRPLRLYELQMNAAPKKQTPAVTEMERLGPAYRGPNDKWSIE